jgi:putative glutamine amidotransferase
MINPPLIGLTTVRSIGKDNRIRDGLTQDYAQAITQSGGVPVLIPLSTLEVNDEGRLLRSLFARLDGIVLPGGGDVHPSHYGCYIDDTIRGVSEIRDAVELRLARWAFEENVPLLGICRGHQVLNIALGGSLHNDILTLQGSSATLRHDADHERERDKLMHTVTVAPESRLAHAMQSVHVEVNSLHHQAINRLAEPLVQTAAADDGIVEGVEVPQHRFMVGVQWHPEAIATHTPMQHLFRTFVEACGQPAVAG